MSGKAPAYFSPPDTWKCNLSFVAFANPIPETGAGRWRAAVHADAACMHGGVKLNSKGVWCMHVVACGLRACAWFLFLHQANMCASLILI